jgi:hypothetical protein
MRAVEFLSAMIGTFSGRLICYPGDTQKGAGHSQQAGAGLADRSCEAPLTMRRLGTAQKLGNAKHVVQGIVISWGMFDRNRGLLPQTAERGPRSGWGRDIRDRP